MTSFEAGFQCMEGVISICQNVVLFLLGVLMFTHSVNWKHFVNVGEG